MRAPARATRCCRTSISATLSRLARTHRTVCSAPGVNRRTAAKSGWKVFVDQPLLPLRLQSTGYYVLTLTLILMALAGAVLGARGFAAAVTRPLEELVRIVRNISAQGTAAQASITSTPPAEI